MNYLSERKRNRLKQWDYNQNGAYFITICTDERKCLLATVVGDGILDVPKINLTSIGIQIETTIQYLKQHQNLISVDNYVIMPNHLHLILSVNNHKSQNASSKFPLPANAAIPKFVSSLKRHTNKFASYPIWQRSFHDRIIRCEKEYIKIWNYVETNPANWNSDCFFIPQSAD